MVENSSKALEAGKALEIIRDVAYTTALKHREEGRRVLADMIDAALAASAALPPPKEEEPIAWRWGPSDGWHLTEDRRMADYARSQGWIVAPLYASASPVLADEGVTERLRHTCDVAEAFLAYFNVFDLAEDKSQQWQALEREIQLSRAALSPPAVTP